MRYIDAVVNGGEGAFVDRAIALLKQADSDTAALDEANKRLNARLTDSLNDLKSASIAIENLNRALGMCQSDFAFFRKENGRLTNALDTAQAEINKMRLASNIPGDIQNKITTAQADIGSVLRKLSAASDVLDVAHQCRTVCSAHNGGS